MLVQVITDNHIRAHDTLVADIEAALEDSLARFAPQVTRVEVHLADENSHKGGGNDKRCALEARLAGLAPVAASATADEIKPAIDAAIDKLVAQLDHKLGRLNDRKKGVSFGGEAGD
jgi:ribosome-associated translation inhibitor RaiA